MSIRFVERRPVHVAALFSFLGAVAVGCSSTPSTQGLEATETTSEALHTGPTKCPACQTLDCQTCGTADGCKVPVTSCTCDIGVDGTACSDTNKCDLGGTCSGGSCISRGKVTCTAPDQCHVASCNASTGCTSTPVADGTPCGTGQVCSAGTCITPCGLITCASAHMQCGQTGDGCGHIIDCGTCTAPETCGGGGVPSVCGAPQCTRQTCAQIGASCGEQADGCGGLIACGTCTAPQTCGGSGVHNVCGTGPACVRKTCANYPAGTCGQQADGCGGATPDCNPCPSPETCGGAGVLDACGFCGGFGFGPCPYGCNAGAIDDGNGHCVQCSSLSATVSMNTTSQQPTSPFWNVEFDYSIGLPNAPSFTGVVGIADTASGSQQNQAVSGPSGKATFEVPMLTTESTGTIFASLSKANDPVCVVEVNPIATFQSWSDPTSSSLCTPPKTPNFTNYAAGTGDIGSRQGPVTIVPLLWGFNDAAFAANLNVVYTQFETSNYYAWLRREYTAPELHHTYPIVASASTTTGSVKDQLGSLIRNGNIPNEGYLVYVVHLAPGQVVNTSSLGTICVSGGNYAYNTSDSGWDINGGFLTFFYVVVPDPRTTCYGATLGQNNFTTILSHELAENLTDPDPYGVTGWEDKNCTGNGPQSQIGDLCVPTIPVSSTSTRAAAIHTPYYNAATGSSDLVVQKLWSNRMAACVTEDAPAVLFN